MDLSIGRLGECDYGRWTRLAAESSSGSVYALPDYLDALCAVTGGRFELLGVFHRDELVGGMPLYLERTRWGEIAAYRPLLSYQSPLVGDFAASDPGARTAKRAAILTALERGLRAYACLHMDLIFRHPIDDVRPFLTAGWSVQPHYSYLVDIADPSEAWKRMDRNQRRLVRRAEAAGLTFGESDDFAAFYRLHRGLGERKGAPIYLPEDAFRAFFDRLRGLGLCRLFAARRPDGRVAAVQLVLTGPRSVSHSAAAASEAEAMTDGVNPFLRWKTFEALSGLGYRINDLLSAPYPHEVTRFKSQLGGELTVNWRVTRPATRLYRWRRRLGPIIKAVRRLVG